VQLEGLDKFEEKFNYLIGNQIRDLPICSMAGNERTTILFLKIVIRQCEMCSRKEKLKLETHV
jgi:hypothetical protein